MRYADGRRYEGCFADGLRSGRGVLHGADGATVAGEWRCDLLWRLGRRCGEGTATLRGKVSTRPLADDAPTATGALVDHARNAYRGEFADGLKHGVGEQTYADGAVYKGEWVRGAPRRGHSCGNATGDLRGSWVAGRPHGEGTLTRPDGTSHAGGFVRGAPHGWGVVTTASEERECARRRRRREDDVKITHGAGGQYVGATLGACRTATASASGPAVRRTPEAGSAARRWQGRGAFANGFHDGEWQNDHPALVGGGTLKSAWATRVFER
ncbi:hypothetical protein JL720_11760 [Aureococcus anophagefferens]|nr:hypothetical protein JL720_11760 [Aureococcus anophagefferens]